MHWTCYTITLKWLQWQIYNLYFVFEPSSRLEMAVAICIVIDFQRAKNSKYTITQRSRLLMGAWETFVSHTDALQSIYLNLSQSNNVSSEYSHRNAQVCLFAFYMQYLWDISECNIILHCHIMNPHAMIVVFSLMCL